MTLTTTTSTTEQNITVEDQTVQDARIAAATDGLADILADLGIG